MTFPNANPNGHMPPRAPRGPRPGLALAGSALVSLGAVFSSLLPARAADFVLTSFSTQPLAGQAMTNATGQFSIVQPRLGWADTRATGGNLTLASLSLNVILMQQTHAPRLLLTGRGSSTRIEWQEGPGMQGFILQKNLTLQPGGWSPASSIELGLDGLRRHALNPATNTSSAVFYRLVKP